jgi:hypothetical protein
LGNAEDKFAWLRDEEFARETLAGMNPYAIELVRVSPSPSISNITFYLFIQFILYIHIQYQDIDPRKY